MFARYLFLHVASRAVFLALSNYPSYLYLVVVWIVRGGYLMSVYTPSQQIPTPTYHGERDVQTWNENRMSGAASSNNRLRSSAAARPTS